MSLVSKVDIEILKEAGYTQEEIDLYIEEKNKNNINQTSDSCECISMGIDCRNSYNFNKLSKLDEFEFIKHEKYTSIVNNNKRIYIETPKLFLPFGIDKYYNNWSVNFEIKDKKCKGYQEFINYLVNLEVLIRNKLNIEENKLNSQIKKNTKFNMEFYGRIQSYNKKIKCIIIDKRNNINQNVNLYNFPRGIYVKAKLRLGNLWNVNDMFCYKYNITELNIVE